ncbi:spore coat putative kinase YutH [Bacillus massilinigeriensis]|uniref:spore coat putative kinase YutH n=1 Tax=Bacillus mediterraneensis TaxID=1805474 RepID=UPI0008F92BB4|nr:spore coat protein YutH [Bacillus mediterraneensis]
MFEKMLKEHYGLKAGTEIDLEGYRAFKKENSLYLIMKANQLKEQEISELSQIASQLKEFGDKDVPEFLRTNTNMEYCEWEDNRYSVLHCAEPALLKPAKTAKKLARFHMRGRMIPFHVNSINRIGQWKQLWEQRVDQMEAVWNEKLFQDPENNFERDFIDSYPYYMCLAENAIQYLVDTELDMQPGESDSGTVCHERFSATVWGTKHIIKNPFDWVFDHQSRDLAEWVRGQYFRNTQVSQQKIRTFLLEYQSVGRLTPFSWRLLYARLLFPLHYFETVENYYDAQSDQQRHELEEKMTKFLKQATEHERFLSAFFQLAEAPVRTMNLPMPSWLILQPL